MKLSILIPTLNKRRNLFQQLVQTLKSDPGYNNLFIEILNDSRESISIGQKRNDLLRSAMGEYICFIDDDDLVSSNYIEQLLKGIETNPDCCSLKGIITTNGNCPEIFERSLKYTKWKTTDNSIKYERNPNHLNCIKASIAKQFQFPLINFSEDYIGVCNFKKEIFQTESLPLYSLARTLKKMSKKYEGETKRQLESISEMAKLIAREEKL